MAGIFLGGLVQLGSFGDIQNNLKIRVMTAHPGHILLQISTTKLVFQNFIFHLISFIKCFPEIFKAWKFSMGFFFFFFFLLEVEGGNFWSKDFFGF